MAIHFLLTSSPIDDIFLEDTLKVIYERYGTEFSFFSEFGGGGEESGLFLKEQGDEGYCVGTFDLFSFSGSKIQQMASLGGGGY